MNKPNDVVDRRETWTPPPRPEWLATLNRLGGLLDAKGVVSLDAESLMDQARANTGLSDFGDDIWIGHFRKLLELIEAEAKLTFFGRIWTRSDFLNYLQARLQITDWYKRFPEIDRQEVTQPVFIIGFGRSGTTILQELLSHDPQFRSVQRWEALFPCPPPTEETYTTDPRIAKTRGLDTVLEAASPPWRTMHAWGATIPVEDPEFTYAAFFSEVWPHAFQIPSYEPYFNSQDQSYYFWWHKRVLKLLQWRFKRKHWLLKSPTSLPRLAELIKAYPDAKIIFTHRDPIVSGDSVINVVGTVYHWRTDDPFGGKVLDEWLLAGARAELWDRVIALIENGTLRAGTFSNFLHHKFLEDPIGTVRKTYEELGLEKSESVFAAMQAFLDSRPKGGFGAANKYAKAELSTVEAERKDYHRYQSYFGIPNER